MSKNSHKQAFIKIAGKVQGVFFRAHAREKACALGLNGYARNMQDGSVEILAQGLQPSIEAFIVWCKEGSPAAKVEIVSAQWRPAGEIYNGFSTF